MKNGQVGYLLEIIFFVKTSLFFTVLSARNDTVSPDFVLNFTDAGFLTVLTATNLTFCFAMEGFYH